MIQKRELLHIWKELDINQNKYTMDKEDYVSLKVAKLLKEKGFDEYCEAYYHLCCDDATEEECFEKSSDKDFKNSNNKFRVGSPTLYEAQKWLRDKHMIHVNSDYDNSSRDWFYSILGIDRTGNLDIFSRNQYNSYEKALDNGILEALKYI